MLARFFAEGFEAAAVTAFGARPFGFLAVHRPSRLAVVAGWVKRPFQPD